MNDCAFVRFGYLTVFADVALAEDDLAFFMVPLFFAPQLDVALDVADVALDVADVALDVVAFAAWREAVAFAFDALLF